LFTLGLCQPAAAFSLYKNALRRAFSDGSQALQGRYESMQVLAAGALAGATSNLALYPLELARSRLATSTKYTGIGDCMGHIVKNQGVRSIAPLNHPLSCQSSIIHTVVK